jgi:hypothetical protein
MWVKVSGPNRFLRIVIDRQKADSDVDLMASIGHGLQHAIEALIEPAVTNGHELYHFFSRYAPTDSSRFATTAALNAGVDIRHELRVR